MAEADLPVLIWRLDRADEWRAIVREVRFSDAWNRPYAEGKLKPARPPDPPGVLNRWGGPVLILHGERDLVFPLEVARRLRAVVPAADLVILGEAGHMAHFDDAGGWLGALRAFLTGRQALA